MLASVINGNILIVGLLAFVKLVEDNNTRFCAIDRIISSIDAGNEESYNSEVPEWAL